MKLRLLYPTHRCSINILAIVRKLGILNVIEQTPGRSDVLLVIANGSPEDQVLPILAKTVDEAHIVDVAFPLVHKGHTVFNVIKDYIDQSYTRIVVILDQERWCLSKLIDYIRQRIENQKLHIIDISKSNREVYLRVCENTKTVLIGVIVNGLDDPRFAKHTIETHLHIVAERRGITSIPGTVEDPKSEWRKLSREERLLVLRQLLEEQTLIEEIFRQHVKVLKRILEGISL